MALRPQGLVFAFPTCLDCSKFVPIGDSISIVLTPEKNLLASGIVMKYFGLVIKAAGSSKRLNIFAEGTLSIRVELLWEFGILGMEGERFGEVVIGVSEVVGHAM